MRSDHPEDPLHHHKPPPSLTLNTHVRLRQEPQGAPCPLLPDLTCQQRSQVHQRSPNHMRTLIHNARVHKIRQARGTWVPLSPVWPLSRIHQQEQAHWIQETDVNSCRDHGWNTTTKSQDYSAGAVDLPRPRIIQHMWGLQSG